MALPVGFNLITQGEQALGLRFDPLLACHFMVELDGLFSGGFSQVDGLECSFLVQEYREGGVNGYAHKLLTGASYPNLGLSRGYTGNNALWEWFERARQGDVRRKTGTLTLLADNSWWPIRSWDINDALPVRWVGPSFDSNNQSSKVPIERLELVHRGITECKLSQMAYATYVGRIAYDRANSFVSDVRSKVESINPRGAGF